MSVGRVVRAEISTEPFDENEVVAQTKDDKAGAIIMFNGVVRNHDHGDQVESIEYSSHELAEKVLREIATEIASRDGIHAVSAVHRTGLVKVGETAMVVVVAGSHRSMTFEAASDFVDEIKARVPVWKKQNFPDGNHEWAGLTDL
ncbi:MAG: molybdenum cofactor biosynthesis protein MoaE [Actinomycetaceae bacterium]|nr:molybdenum cofactor biosynthesis protein MoaE [Actinomycetaceae bacterium]